eukprot:7216877-Heterocapsa_arctica.AAC.1
MTEIRQANLAKPGKVKKGRLKVEDTRPISVMSIWWRLWATTWVRSEPVTEWRRAYLKEEIAGVQGAPGSEECAAELCEAFAHDGYIVSLDYSLAFDTMSPGVTVAAMDQLHWPKEVSLVLASVWGKQRRWLQWQGHTHQEPLLVTGSLPQGDPWCPLVMAMWMQSAACTVQKQVDEARKEAVRMAQQQGEGRTEAARWRERCKVAIYMDDRTWATNNAWMALKRVLLWLQWSRNMNLKENDVKTQIAGSSKDHCRKLEEVAVDMHMEGYMKET